MYHNLILIDREHEKPFTDEKFKQLLYSRLWFESDKVLILQNRDGLFKIRIDSNLDELKLEEKKAGGKIVLGQSYHGSKLG